MAEIVENEEQVLSPEETLKELKKNTVAKDRYDELQQKYNRLYAETANGTFFADEEEPKGLSEEEQLEKFNKTISNFKEHKIKGSYANMKALLEVDDYLTSHGQRSAFAPKSGTLSAADEDMCTAMHDILTYCVDNSGGSDEVASAMYAQCLSNS